MIKISVLYPNTEGVTFDFDYFLNKHFPMVLDLIGDKVKQSAVEQGISGGPQPGSPAPFVAMAHLYFANMEDFQSGMSAGGPTIMNDIPNYTNAQPVIQISEVML